MPGAPEGAVIGDGQRDQISFRQVVTRGGAATAATMFGLNAVDDVDRAAIAVLGPDIQDAFGISDTMLTFVTSVGSVVAVLCAIPLAVLGDRVLRTKVLAATSLVWAMFALASGFVQTAWQLAAARIGTGGGKGTDAVQRSLLADAYPIEGRGRVFAVHQLANPVGAIVGPVLAGGVAVLVGGTAGWRWALAVLAIPVLGLGVAALRLSEPRRGANELRAELGDDDAAGADGGAPGDQPDVWATSTVDDAVVALPAAWARLKQIPTYFTLMTALGVIGIALFGVPTVLNLFLEERHGLGSLGRGVVSAGVTAGGAVGVIVGGLRADLMLRTDPPRVLRLIGLAVFVYGVTLPVSLLMPHPALYVAVNAVGSFSVSLTLAPAAAVVAAIVPFTIRSVAFAMIPIYAVLVGGFGGAVLTGLLSDSFGRRTALVCVVMPAMGLGGLLLVHASRFVRKDMSVVVAELRADRAERERLASLEPHEVPVLQVHDLDVFYGSVQVLSGVGIDVGRGEVLAVLGTNGAGKSTLVRTISGLVLPRRGVVRHGGHNITHASAQARVRRGIVHVSGGGAVFPDLTVAENLICGAYTLGWDPPTVTTSVERSLDLLPALAGRLRQRAGTLSGGEQQMLAIAKGLLLDPDVLIVDELTLGLAPSAVDVVLDAVRTLRANGVTMIVVEQSIDVASAVADRAVFLERGSVRFDAPVSELRVRTDLVRPVFLRAGDGA